MGGIIRSIISPGAKKAKREKRAVQAVNAERATRLAKQKKEEGLVEQARGKRRVAAAGRKRRVFTSPLGITDTGTETLA